MKTLILSLLLLAAPLAEAAEEHIFVALSEKLQRKVTLIAPAEPTRPPRLTISKMLDQYPWEQTLLQVDVIDLQLTADRGTRFQKAGNGFTANLGANGQIQMNFLGDHSCQVISTLAGFNMPEAETISVCTYFYSRGPRPGFSGSN